MTNLTALLACSVCYGDPTSLLSKGAVAGVAVLLGIVLLVLSLIVAVSISWVRRAKKLASLSS